MLRHFRVRWWCFATSLALAVGTAGASFETLLHAADNHDAACAPLLAGPHDASAHRLQSAKSASQDVPDQHCLACHWARSFRTHQPASGLAVHDDGGTLRARPASVRLLAVPVFADLPPRSPPSVA